MHKRSSKPAALMKLTRAAREIGVRAETIEKHPADFFGVQRLGSQRYVVTAEFQNWLISHAAAHAQMEAE